MEEEAFALYRSIIEGQGAFLNERFGTVQYNAKDETWEFHAQTTGEVPVHIEDISGDCVTEICAEYSRLTEQKMKALLQEQETIPFRRLPLPSIVNE
jgi:hypothetical protein